MPASSGPQVVTVHEGHKLLIRPLKGVQVMTGPSCPSRYNFCFAVTPGNPGPYIETSDGTAPLYNAASIVKAKNNKVDKKFSNYFSPDPGDPTYQYINYKGKVKKATAVKFDDVYCIGFSASQCGNGTGSVLNLGIYLTP
ncbi:MAG TPA: hypothetical protein VEW74_09065 [Candidatus Nitrosotalea sp.]|nr:hypothetical protein [Candidatus Nitrosotalea sp.]